MTPEELRKWYSDLGKRARRQQLAESTPAERSELASKAAKARWAAVRAAKAAEQARKENGNGQ